MNTTTFEPTFVPAARRGTTRLVLRCLDQLAHGTLSVRLPDGQVSVFGSGEPHASIQLRNWNLFGAAMSSGDIGVAETYMAGDWSTPSLPALLRVLVRNRNALESVVYGSWWGRLAYRVRHLLRRNSRTGSRRNIQAHYDLGNAFYGLWLDPTMNYSSALFEGDATRSMPEAQDAKVRRALTAAGVREGDRVLEIGCGWGALAEMGARDFAAHVTGVTLSTEQLAYAKDRLDRAGLAASADLRLQDYRDIDDGPYDAVCSIEMVEAVGRAYWPGYFAKVAGMLKPGGRACIQTIVMSDELWPRYIAGTDFIQQYIFPGGCLPCPREFERHARDAGLEVVESFGFGQDYATTLARWRESFVQHDAQVRALGFDEQFMRVWEFYLAYCEAAFAECNTDVVQYTLRKR